MWIDGHWYVPQPHTTPGELAWFVACFAYELFNGILSLARVYIIKDLRDLIEIRKIFVETRERNPMPAKSFN